MQLQHRIGAAPLPADDETRRLGSVWRAARRRVRFRLLLGSATQFVAVKRRRTEFVVSDTFASDAVGKDLQGMAISSGARDAIRADSELVAPPTTVG